MPPSAGKQAYEKATYECGLPAPDHFTGALYRERCDRGRKNERKESDKNDLSHGE